MAGTLAQLVEQWTENPCVPGSIPGGTTKVKAPQLFEGLFLVSKIRRNLLRNRRAYLSGVKNCLLCSVANFSCFW